MMVLAWSDDERIEVYCKKMQKKCKKMQNLLHMSKKSSTFGAVSGIVPAITI